MLKLTLRVYLLEYDLIRKLNRAAGRVVGRGVMSPSLEHVAKEQSKFFGEMLRRL